MKRPRPWRFVWAVGALAALVAAAHEATSTRDARDPAIGAGVANATGSTSPHPAALASVAAWASASPGLGDAATDGGVGCGLELPTPAASIRGVPEALLAKAVIPSLDPSRMWAPVVTRDGGQQGLLDCQGHFAGVVWDGEVIGAGEADRPSPRGTVRVSGTSALPRGRLAIWLSTGHAGGASSTDNGYWAIVHLEGARVVIDGTAEWGGFSTRLRIEQLGGETVYVAQTGWGGSGVQSNASEEVWRTRGGMLVRLGEYETSREAQAVGWAAGGSPGAWDPPELEATPSFVGGAITVHQRWSWRLFDPDAVAPVVHELRVDRRYALVGDALRLQGDAADPMPPGPPGGTEGSMSRPGSGAH